MGKYLLAVAGAALMGAATTGAAKAADIMPVVPVVTPVIVAPVGPTVELTVEKWLELGIFPGEGRDLELFGDFDLKITAASGLGFQLVIEDGIDLNLPILPLDILGEATARVFKTMGAVEIGAYAGFGFSIPGGIGGSGVGFDFALDTDAVTIESYVQANFGGGGFQNLLTEAEVTFHVSEMLDLFAGARLQTDFITPALNLWAGAQIDFGVLAPYADIYFGIGGHLWAEIGVDLEYQIGDGPFTLLGNLEVDFAFPGTAFFAGVGIRYGLGGG